MIYEVRDYHYRKDLFEEYKAWAEEPVPGRGQLAPPEA